jgi:transposase
LRTKRTTGLSPEQFADLIYLVEEEIGQWNPVTGRLRALPLAKAVKATVMYFKNNITQEVIGELLEVSQPTISRVIADLETVICAVLAEWVPDLDEAITGRVVIVDGTLTPCWSWADVEDLYSGKHKTTGHNHQVLVCSTGLLLHISDPLPGARHDTHCIEHSGLLDRLDLDNTIGDKGYLGTGMHTPYRRPPGGELLGWQKEFNAAISRIRSTVEREIANWKTWRITHTDYRRPEHTYQKAFNAVRALHFFKLQSEF